MYKKKKNFTEHANLKIEPNEGDVKEPILKLFFLCFCPTHHWTLTAVCYRRLFMNLSTYQITGKMNVCFYSACGFCLIRSEIVNIDQHLTAALYCLAQLGLQNFWLVLEAKKES